MLYVRYRLDAEGALRADVESLFEAGTRNPDPETTLDGGSRKLYSFKSPRDRGAG